MPKSGTTQSSILRRRRHNANAARLGALIRRLTIPAALLVLAALLILWLSMSSLPGRVAGSIAHGFYSVTADAGFTVQNILVEGRVNTDPDTLRQLVGMERGMPIFAFKPSRVKTSLEALSWVKRARIERRLPDTIYIDLEERTPLALWQNKGKLKVIDGDGVVLTESNLAPFRDLLLVVGENAPAHVGDLNLLLNGDPDLQTRMEAATFVSGRRWDLRLKNGITVRLPETDAAQALARLGKAQKDDQLLDKNLTVIDLRDADRIIVATKPGDAQDYKPSAKPGHNI